MDYDRLPLNDDPLAESMKMLSISVLECAVILVKMVVCGES